MTQDTDSVVESLQVLQQAMPEDDGLARSVLAAAMSLIRNQSMTLTLWRPLENEPLDQLSEQQGIPAFLGHDLRLLDALGQLATLKEELQLGQQQYQALLERHEALQSQAVVLAQLPQEVARLEQELQQLEMCREPAKLIEELQTQLAESQQAVKRLDAQYLDVCVNLSVEKMPEWKRKALSTVFDAEFQTTEEFVAAHAALKAENEQLQKDKEQALRIMQMALTLKETYRKARNADQARTAVPTNDVDGSQAEISDRR